MVSMVGKNEEVSRSLQLKQYVNILVESNLDEEDFSENLGIVAMELL